MSIYGRDEISPQWEPTPWAMDAEAADEQERGFHERATKAIEWQPIPWKAVPADGIFGHSEDWFSSADVEFTASADGEELLLIRNVWNGFPDPPEWGLASRPSGRSDVKWERWGHFAELPSAWMFPGVRPG